MTKFVQLPSSLNKEFSVTEDPRCNNDVTGRSRKDYLRSVRALRCHELAASHQRNKSIFIDADDKTHFMLKLKRSISE